MTTSTESYEESCEIMNIGPELTIVCRCQAQSVNFDDPWILNLRTYSTYGLSAQCMDVYMLCVDNLRIG